MKQILLPCQKLKRNANCIIYLPSPWDIYIPGRAVGKPNTLEDLGFFLTQAVVTQSLTKMWCPSWNKTLAQKTNGQPRLALFPLTKLAKWFLQCQLSINTRK